MGKRNWQMAVQVQIEQLGLDVQYFLRYVHLVTVFTPRIGTVGLSKQCKPRSDAAECGV